MTNAEAIEEAKRIEASIEARIVAGEIPPRPVGYDRDAHSSWFAKYLACVEPTHRYFVRERGGDRCAECVRRGRHSGVRYEVVRYEAMTLPSFVGIDMEIKNGPTAEEQRAFREEFERSYRPETRHALRDKFLATYPHLASWVASLRPMVETIQTPEDMLASTDARLGYRPPTPANQPRTPRKLR